MVWLLLDYDVVWAQPGTMVRRVALLNQPPSSAADVVRQALNWEVMEAGAPRITRPLSNLVEVLDTLARTALFSRVLPHPAVSLTWILSLVVSPWLLLRALALLPVDPPYRWLGASVYLSTSGVLSLVVMSFRPGKAIACFFFVVLLYLSLRMARSGGPAAAGRQRLAAFGLIVVYFVSLFSDEIALFGLLIPLAVIGPSARRQAHIIVWLLLATVAYVVVIEWVMPVAHARAGFPVIGPYDLEVRLYDLLALRAPWSDYGQALWSFTRNVVIAFLSLSTLGLFADPRPGWSHVAAVGTVVLSGLVLIVGLRRRSRSPDAGLDGARYLRIFALLLASALIFHSGLLFLTPHPVWGLYWYGAFVSLPWVLLFVVGLQALLRGTTHEFVLSQLLTVTIVWGSLQLFVPTNEVYKRYHYYGPAPLFLSDVFSYRTNLFEVARQGGPSGSLRDITARFARIATAGEVRAVPKELLYLLAETRYCRLDGDYYHMRQTADLPGSRTTPAWWRDVPARFDVLCFLTYLPELRTELERQARQTPAADAAWIGVWEHQGRPYVSGPVPGGLLFVNEHGDRAVAAVDGTTVFAFGRRGVLDTRGRIRWDDGTIWQR